MARLKIKADKKESLIAKFLQYNLIRAFLYFFIITMNFIPAMLGLKPFLGYFLAAALLFLLRRQILSSFEI